MDLQEATGRSQVLVGSLRSTLQQIGRLPKEPSLAQDIQEALKQHEEGLELLQQDVEDLSSAADRAHGRDSERLRESTRLAAQVARLTEDLKHARNQYRRAQSSAKRLQEAAKQAEREARLAELKKAYASDKPVTTDLFAGRRPQKKQLTEDELLMNTSSDITLALRQTHNQMASELSRSRFAQETLAQSTAALSDLGERYMTLDTLLANSRNLLGTLVKSQKSDTWYLQTTLWILAVTLGWLVFRRWIYGPAWWFIWLPLRWFLYQPLAYLIRSMGGRPEGIEVAMQQSSVTRPPLKIQPSATGGGVRMPPGAERIPHRVGMGGMGAKMGPSGETREQAEGLADRIGRMVEESRLAAEGLADAEAEADGMADRIERMVERSKQAAEDLAAAEAEVDAESVAASQEEAQWVRDEL